MNQMTQLVLGEPNGFPSSQPPHGVPIIFLFLSNFFPFSLPIASLEFFPFPLPPTPHLSGNPSFFPATPFLFFLFGHHSPPSLSKFYCNFLKFLPHLIIIYFLLYLLIFYFMISKTCDFNLN